MYNDLNGKTGVVTGSSSGIGAAIAERFAKEGMNVVINYYHDKDSADKIVDKIEHIGSHAIAVRADMKNEEEAALLLQTAIEEYGDVDVWVNNAGKQKAFSSHEMPLEEWQSVIDTNLTGVFLGSREALKYFLSKDKKGNIINISSVHEIIPRPTYVHYAASKGGVKLLTQTLAREYAKKGIRVNAIGPGGIDTPINENSTSDPKQREKDEKAIPLGYIGSPYQIANVAAWLASDESSYVTGTTIYADGGLLLYPSPDDIFLDI
ncbi:glucose 1-dehydrogenase [Prevotella sp. 10(H)]|uniref:glucose 1-dehydrogenase n=1 Tax=Prevotella sp. 10(H) TaxID=1158294 RepID=UPI0004A6ECB7|nr:glucose 1-dehydrogenase [Prevotella sp. 10(H)]